jgi:hypothetical protein
MTSQEDLRCELDAQIRQPGSAPLTARRRHRL